MLAPTSSSLLGLILNSASLTLRMTEIDHVDNPMCCNCSLIFAAINGSSLGKSAGLEKK